MVAAVFHEWLHPFVVANASYELGIRPKVRPVVRLAKIKLPALYQQIKVYVGPMHVQMGTAVCLIEVLDVATDAPFEFGCEV